MFSTLNQLYSDSEDEYEWDSTINEESLPEIDKDFRKSILDAKHSLYTNIVISGKEGTPLAQDNTLLNKYLHSVNNLYLVSLHMTKNSNEELPDLSVFPENSRESIRITLEWIKRYFNENTVPETIPYRDYIQKSFHEYPYVQTDNFE
jgi:hypothetical protein